MAGNTLKQHRESIGNYQHHNSQKTHQQRKKHKAASCTPHFSSTEEVFVNSKANQFTGSLTSTEILPSLRYNSKLPARQSWLGILLLAMLLSADLIEGQETEFSIGDSLPSKERKNCEQTERKIRKLSKHFPHINHARTSADGQLKISCDNKQHLLTGASVFFSASTETIYLDASQVTDNQDISHEFIHADIFFSNKRCGVRKGEAGIPVHPVTTSEIQKLNHAFDKGDKRIAEFKALMIKENRGNKLTTTEKQTLSQYKKACKDVIIWQVTLFVTEKECKFIQNKLKTSNPYRAHADAYGGKFSFSEAGFNPVTKQYYLKGKPLEPATATILIPQSVKANLDTAYRTAHPALRLAERHAYTFQSMPEDARQAFYPEACSLIEKNLSCDHEEENTHRTRNEL